MDTTIESGDESVSRITRLLAEGPDLPAVMDEPTQPAELVSTAEPIEPARQPARSGATMRRRRRRWLRLTWRIVKSLLLTAELGATLVLASYAGLIKILPVSPPHVSVASTGHAVVARTSSYCWFTPGRATCIDGSEQAIAAQKLPQVTLARGDNLRFTFGYPAPTHCAATAVAPTNAGASPTALGALSRAAGSSSLAGSRLPVILTPGSYVVTIACDWTPRSTMRWLQGQGSSSYLLAVTITARH